jgi:hypothetical protein
MNDNASVQGIDPKQAYFDSLLSLTLDKSAGRHGSDEMQAAMSSMPPEPRIEKWWLIICSMESGVWSLASIARQSF